MARVAGMVFVKVDGQQFQAKGAWTYNLGAPKREAVIGADRVHGYKEVPQVAYIEGEITDAPDLALEAFVRLENSTVTLELANGKVVSLRDAYYAADGEASTEEANVEVRFEGVRAEEITD